MSEIPEDIKVTVDTLLDAAWDGDQYCFLRDRIEGAILAERKRCADIVKTMPSNYGALVMRRDAAELIEAGA